MFSFYHCQDAAPFSAPPGNSRFAGLLPDSEVILVVDIAEIPEKRAFRGVCPHPVYFHLLSAVGTTPPTFRFPAIGLET
jgi:hypothetical protein